MSFGTIGNFKAAYQRVDTAAQTREFESEKQRAEKVLSKFREVSADLVSLNDTSRDRLPEDPGKVIADREAIYRPRFENQSHQTAFKVARFLFPPLLLAGTECFDKPSLSGVAELDAQSSPTRLNAEVGPNRATGESKMKLDYHSTEDGTERYQLSSYTPVTIADAWYGGKPLGRVEHASVARTETVEVKDGEFSYRVSQPNLSSKTTHLELFERGLKVAR